MFCVGRQVRGTHGNRRSHIADPGQREMEQRNGLLSESEIMHTVDHRLPADRTSDPAHFRRTTKTDPTQPSDTHPPHQSQRPVVRRSGTVEGEYRRPASLWNLLICAYVTRFHPPTGHDHCCCCNIEHREQGKRRLVATGCVAQHANENRAGS